MKTTLTSTVNADGVITIDRRDFDGLLYDVAAYHQRLILDATDRMVIKRLVELGWTPPDGKKTPQDG